MNTLKRSDYTPLLPSCGRFGSPWLPIGILLPEKSLRLLEKSCRFPARLKSSLPVTMPKRGYLAAALAGLWLFLIVSDGFCGPLTVQNMSGGTWSVGPVPLNDGASIVHPGPIVNMYGPSLLHSVTNNRDAMAYVLLTADEEFIASDAGQSSVDLAKTGFFLGCGWLFIGLMVKMFTRITKHVPEGIAG